MEDMYRTFEGLHHLAVLGLGSTKGQYLLLKKGRDGLYGIACFELLGERMVDQLHPCLFLVVLQGGVEEELKATGRRVTHFNDGRTVNGGRGMCVM